MDGDGLMTQQQLAVWLRFAGVLELLPAAINLQLVRDSDLTLFDFFVLDELSVAPQHTLRVTDLAACTNASLPRLSRVASRLESGGLVERKAGDGDARVTNVRLTDAGAERLAAALPGHLATVKSLLLDSLSAQQVEQLGAIAELLLERLHPGAVATLAARQPVQPA